MPKAREWTACEDETIQRMRAAGATWEAIGKEISVGRNMTIERGRRLNAAAPEQHREKTHEERRNGKEALRPGHPLTWGLISESPYPALR